MLVHKKEILFFILMISTIPIMAQDYFLNFKATGATNVISTVHVKNQSTGDTLLMAGDDILRLTAISGTGSVNQKKTSMTLSPNPANGRTALCLENFPHDLAKIEISDIKGRVVATSTDLLIDDICCYIITGLGTGSYIVRVNCQTKTMTAKVLSFGNSNYEISIERELSDKSSSEKQTVNKNRVWQMIYHDGESLIFTAKNSFYTTIFTDVPAGSKTEWFEFTDCTDADSNHYPVVRICNQTWMARNLNVGKLAEVPHNNGFIEKQCYGYRISNCNIYGGLYSWDEMMNYQITEGSRGICPFGWHIPSLGEWRTLFDCVGGAKVAAGKLKEADTIHWTPPNTGAENTFGFSALPGGDYDLMAFHYGNLGTTGFFWTSSLEVSSLAYFCYMMNNSTQVRWQSFFFEDEFSVRCLKDQTSP